MQVFNLQSPRSGQPVANQFLILLPDGTKVFRSYQTDIVKVLPNGDTFISDKWDCSRTTKKYTCQFLDTTGGQIVKKLASGEYKTWVR
jgi:hypothetical protein